MPIRCQPGDDARAEVTDVVTDFCDNETEFNDGGAVVDEGRLLICAWAR